MSKNLDHLLDRADEIQGVSGHVGGRLRYIREDIEPMILGGLPVKHLTSELAKLGVTRRVNSVRKFIREEYPDAYDRYYAKRPIKGVPSAGRSATADGEVNQTAVERDHCSTTHPDKPKGTTSPKPDPEATPKPKGSLTLSELSASFREGVTGKNRPDIDD